MSYMYSSQVVIEVVPPDLFVVEGGVSIKPDKTRVIVGEPVKFSVQAKLSRLVEPYDANYFAGVEFVLAVNRQDNIVVEKLAALPPAGRDIAFLSLIHI